MRIGLNLSFVVPGETGGSETYVRGLVPELLDLVGPDSVTLFVSPELAAERGAGRWGWGDVVRVVVVPVPGRSRLRRTAGEQLVLPLLTRRARIDVLHNLASTSPVVSGARATVTTILDLLFLHHPETHSRLLARGMGVLVPLAARRSTRLIAISEATRDDIVTSLGIDPGRIDVVHLGPGPAGTTPATPEGELRDRLDLGPGPVLLSPSARRAHKNLDRLLDAFARLEPGPMLVVPGYRTGAEDALAARAAALGVADRVRFTGWLDDADLGGLYAMASALVFPSLAEGFGLPVLEAMRHGLPVACADRTSLPEIAGDAAVLFDPESVEAIAQAMRRLLGDAALAADLAARGRARAALFSWKRAARETLQAYERALGSSR